MVELANPSISDKIADLGSGDGRISIEFAKLGCAVDGYELESDLVLKSQAHIQSLGLDSKISIKQKDFWDIDLSPYNVVAVYPMPDIMLRLEKKLRTELQPGSRVVTNYYHFPNWKHAALKDHIYLYIK